MDKTDTFHFLTGASASHAGLMDQAGAANDRMYVIGRYPDLTKADSLSFDGTQVGSEGFLATDYGVHLE